MKFTPCLSLPGQILSLSLTTFSLFHQSQLLLWPHYTPYSYVLLMHKQCPQSRMPFTAPSLMENTHTHTHTHIPPVCLFDCSQRTLLWPDVYFLTLTLHSFNAGISNHQMCDRFSHTEKFCHTSWVPCSLTQFWHYLPEDNIRSHKLRLRPIRPPSHYFRIQLQVQVVTCTSERLTIILRCLQIPASINFLKWLTEFRKQFIY